MATKTTSCDTRPTQYAAVANHLPGQSAGGTVLWMYRVARLLQLIGLAIPPLAIVAQLSESITLGQMLQFLFVAVCVFLMGYLLQRYSGGSE